MIVPPESKVNLDQDPFFSIYSICHGIHHTTFCVVLYIKNKKIFTNNFMEFSTFRIMPADVCKKARMMGLAKTRPVDVSE